MVYVPEEEEWLAAMEKARQEAERMETEDMTIFVPPAHPVPTLQAPFEESIEESNQNLTAATTVNIDARTRRNDLLTDENYERLCGRKWRQRPEEKYHPLWKLVAQISFGVHLLAKGLAKSEFDVMQILQNHVNEIDGLIERTAEDFLLAREDIEERRKFLKIPLENLDLFLEMLENGQFRRAVIKDNNQIEFIIQRTATCMKDAFKDTRKGIDSVHALGQYLEELGMHWSNRPGNLDAVYEAMRGNVVGWIREFKKLQKLGYKLALSLTELSGISVEMQRHVGAVSRRSVIFELSPPTQSSQFNHADKTIKKLSTRSKKLTNVDKPLPTFPPSQELGLGEFITEALLDPRNRHPSPSLSYNFTSSRSMRTSSQRSVSFNVPLEKRRHSIASIDPRMPQRRFSLKNRRNSDPSDRSAQVRPASAPALSLFPPLPTAEQLERKRVQEKSALRAAFESLALFDKPKSSLPRAVISKREPRLKQSRSKLGLNFSFTKDHQRKSTRNGMTPFGFLRSKSVNDLLETNQPTSRDVRFTTPPYSISLQNREVTASRVDNTPQIPHLFMLAEIPEPSSPKNAQENTPTIPSDEASGQDQPVTALPKFESRVLYLSDGSQSGSENTLKATPTTSYENQKNTGIRRTPSKGNEMNMQFPKIETLVAGYHTPPESQELRIKIVGNRKDENRLRPFSKPPFLRRKRPGTRESQPYEHATLISRPSTAKSSIFSKPDPASPATFSFRPPIRSICEEPKENIEVAEPCDIASTRARLGLGVQLGMHANLIDCYTPLSTPSEFGGKHTFFPSGKRQAGKENGSGGVGGGNKKGKEINATHSPTVGGKKTLFRLFSSPSVKSTSTRSISSSVASPKLANANGVPEPMGEDTRSISHIY